ncbi:McrC family protein [Bacillus sp. S35]|uniref:McrC family protein n=1 Tax=Priestia aryabhattai TaxID=412384 RepID=UPI00190A1909|nr:McrC family protein [Priestia aryabhattai]MBK0009714.1 McrC family protein [Bacillus sp. S35]MCM3644477.1 McrC family protein [Priestia aryabhattai]
MGKLLEVKEYDSITCNENFKEDKNYIFLDQESFLELESLILTFNNNDETDGIKFFTLTSKRNIGKVIRAKNYVGIVQMRNGTQLQILPKIDKSNITDTKRTFIRMLRSLKDFPSEIFNETSLKLERMSLYEIFINLYIQEVRNLIKKGIKSAYHNSENNGSIYKGKLIFNEHIKRNIVHKDRFYVSFDDFGVNRAENRLIKATLFKLIKISASSKNIKEMRQLLLNFENINASKNYQKDFSKVFIDRSTKDYKNLMRWSKVFLLNESFTTFSGDTSARALLFPMEKVFEAYVGRSLKKALADTDWNISLQDKGYYLFESQFALKPDIVIEKKDKSKKIILDTKWKALENNPRSNYGIAQSDMYQMYAYAKKYKTNEIWLLYPISSEMVNIEDIHFTSDDNIVVKVFFIDTSNIEESINELKIRWN